MTIYTTSLFEVKQISKTYIFLIVNGQRSIDVNFILWDFKFY